MKRRRIGLLTCEARKKNKRAKEQRAGFLPPAPSHPVLRDSGFLRAFRLRLQLRGSGGLSPPSRTFSSSFCGLQTGTTRNAPGCRTTWLCSEHWEEQEKRTWAAGGLSLSGFPSKSEASRGFLAGLLAYAVSGRPAFPSRSAGQWLFRPTQRNHSGGAALVSHQTSQFAERSRPANNAKNPSIIVELLLRVKMRVPRGKEILICGWAGIGG